MGMASKALKGALGNMDIDKVDDMMADIQESQDVSNEIADAIARPMGFQVIFQIQSSVKDTRIIKCLTGIHRPSGQGTDRSDLVRDFLNFVDPDPVRNFQIFLSPVPV